MSVANSDNLDEEDTFNSLQDAEIEEGGELVIRHSSDWKLQDLGTLEKSSSIPTKKTASAYMIVKWSRPDPNETRNGTAYSNRYARNANFTGPQGTFHYERMLVCMMINAPPGNNLVTFLIGNGQNLRFFDRHLSDRDRRGMFSKCYSLFLVACLLWGIVQLHNQLQS